MSIRFVTMRDILGNVQPATTAVKRPAVPPATMSLKFPGSRTLAMSVVSVAGCANFFSTCAGRR